MLDRAGDQVGQVDFERGVVETMVDDAQVNMTAFIVPHRYQSADVFNICDETSGGCGSHFTVGRDLMDVPDGILTIQVRVGSVVNVYHLTDFRKRRASSRANRGFSRPINVEAPL